jgi:hypothetical protein
MSGRFLFESVFIREIRGLFFQCLEFFMVSACFEEVEAAFLGFWMDKRY